MTAFQKKLTIQVSIAGVAIILLAIGIAVFASSIGTNGRDLITARSELASRSASLGELASLESQYKKAKDYSLMINGAIPREADLFNISRDFQVLATQAGVNHTFAFTGENSVSGSGLGAVSFRLQADGDIQGIEIFVKSLEQFRYLTRLESFAVGRTKDGGNNVSIRGKIFFQK
ncbi:MAG: hypothetical protein Q7R98_02810 [Candidatus Jorgensenbacteria bacterium]|nr:hypothetical protein [Candidatus Jorgensenbacteria bacterium]